MSINIQFNIGWIALGSGKKNPTPMLVDGFSGESMKGVKFREISGPQLCPTLPTEAIARRGFGSADMTEYRTGV